MFHDHHACQPYRARPGNRRRRLARAILLAGILATSTIVAPVPSSWAQTGTLAAGSGSLAANQNVTRSPSDLPRARSQDAHLLGSRSFQIPVIVSQGADPNARIELLVVDGPSDPALTDHAALAWETAAAQPSTQTTPFSYTATSDGEYWFATRTVSGRGPASTIGSVMKVFVDTTPPMIDMVADADGDGNVRVDLSIEDATDPKQIQLRYTTDRVAKWVDVPTPDAGGTVIQPPGDWDKVAVHVTVVDAAGNRNAVQKIVGRPRVASQPIERYASAPVQRYDARPAPYRVGADRSHYQPAADRSADDLPPPASPEQISHGFDEADIAPPVPRGMEETRLVGPDKLPQTSPPTSTDMASSAKPVPPPRPAPRQRPATAAEAFKPIDAPSAVTEIADASASADRLEAPRTEESEGETIETPEGEIDRDSPSPAPYRANRISEETLRGRVPIRYSDSERFSLEYELEAVGVQGVDAIELYGSLDQGKTWSLWGRDPDKVSPFDIETRDQGVFGYRIVVVGQNGLASPRPLAGDPADILVVVDRDVPQARITGAKYGIGSEIGSLVIEYECDDVNLKDRPVALSFSRTPDGPWTTIAGGLTDQGRYAWPADPQLPRAFYLRIDVTDSAGNVGTHVLDQPIDAQGLAPRARIRGFRSM